MATKDTPALVAEPAPVRTKRVIVQRPYGVTDSDQHLGFNNFETVVEYDKSVDLPADMVDYLRSQSRFEVTPNEAGGMRVSRSVLLNVIDA